MNKEIKIFENVEFGQVRTVMIEGEPWFIGKDVAMILGYERPTKAIQDRVDIEDKDEVPIRDSIGRKQKTPIINESGLYSLILSSKLPNAKKFKRWVTSEVLPDIRKNGMYATDTTIDAMLNNPDLMISLLTKYKEEKEERKRLEEEKEKIQKEKENLIHSPKTYTSTEIAKELGFSSARKFNQVLHEKGIIYKQNGIWVLYSQYSDLGYQSIKQSIINEGLESEKIIYSSKWTGEGRNWLINTIFNKGEM